MAYEEKKNSGIARDIHMQLEQGTFAYVESFNIDNNIGYKFSLERFEGMDLRYKLMADRIKWDTTLNKWLIEDYSIRYIDSLREKMIYGTQIRSEEHTSELQSLMRISYAVLCLK